MSQDTDKLCRAIYSQIARVKSLDEMEHAKVIVRAIIGEENVAVVEQLLDSEEKK